MATGFLLISTGAAYLNTLTVSPAQLLLLKSRQPVFVLQALAAIFRGSAGRAVMAGIVLVFFVSLAWIVISSIGRAASLNSLTEYFGRRAATPPASASAGHLIASLCGLHSLRVALIFTAMIASLGAVMISAAFDSREAGALALWLLLTIVWLIWSGLNWFLSLAPVFVAVRIRDVFGSIESAVDLYRNRRWSFFAVAAWYNFVRFIAFALLSSAVFISFLLARRLSGAALLLAVLSILTYLAFMDVLLVGRLAAYLSMILSPQPARTRVALQSRPNAGDDARVDPDELILSDLPLLPS